MEEANEKGLNEGLDWESGQWSCESDHVRQFASVG